MYLSAYVSDLGNRGISSFVTNSLSGVITELQKSMSNLDKIATTPIPLAYSFHLRLTVWAYLFFLPFQVYRYVGWVTIPAVFIAAVIFLGLLEISAQIEMPFGYDESDLDLDKFVADIQYQLAQITAVSQKPWIGGHKAKIGVRCQFPTSIPSSQIISSHLNQPFLPSLSLSAPQILGTTDTQPTPTTMGFAAAFAAPKPPTGPRPTAKTVRDLEIALNANWRHISDESERFVETSRSQLSQLEKKTGLEVGVLRM